MRITKIINNGLVKINDSDGKECIVMGKGIGFNKKIGDEIRKDQIEKVYRMDDPNTQNQFTDLISKIPLIHIEVASMIVEYTENALGRKLRDGIYVALTDHIDFALERIEKNIPLKNTMLSEIKTYYPGEYRIGLEALNIVKRELGVKLPEDEAGYIAIHIIQFSSETETSDFADISVRVIHNILNIIRYTFSLELNPDSIAYERLVVHIKYFAKRIIDGDKKEKISESEFLNKMRSYFDKEYKCCLKIKKSLYVEFGYEMEDDEMMYLCVHIRRVLEDR